MRRRSTSIAAFVLASGLILAGRVADANEDCPPPGPHCRSVKGKFHSAPPPTCASPVGFCTAGELTGNLRGSYSFVMSTLGSSNVRELPGVFFYTGQSVVSLREHGAPGTLLGIDTGTVDLEPTGTHAMAAILTISGGTGSQARKHGHLVLRGTLDLESGEVDGDYQGEVCE